MSWQVSEVVYQALADGDLADVEADSRTVAVVMQALAHRADADGENAGPSKAKLARIAGVTPDRIRVTLRALERFGAITPTGKLPGHPTTAYRINVGRGDLPARGLGDKGACRQAPRGLADKHRGGLSTSPYQSGINQESMGACAQGGLPTRGLADKPPTAIVNDCAPDAGVEHSPADAEVRLAALESFRNRKAI